MTTYWVRLSGKATKPVDCEECGTCYLYVLRRETEGQAGAWFFFVTEGTRKEAHDAAARALEARLAREVDVAPCPKCGHVQREMVWQAKARRGRWLGFVGAVIFGVGVALGVPNLLDKRLDLPWSFIAPLAAIGAVFLAIRCAILLAYDPNKARLEERLALARKVSVTSEDYGRWPRPTN